MKNDKEGALSSSMSSISKRSKKKSKASKLENGEEGDGTGGGGKTTRRMKKKGSSSSLASSGEADGSLSPSKLVRKTSKNKSPAASEASLSSVVEVSPVEKTSKKKKKKKMSNTPQFSLTPGNKPKISATSGRFNGHKSLGDISGLSQSSHSQIDNNSSSSLAKSSSGPVRPLGPIIYDDLPDPRDLMKEVTDDVRALKFEAKSQFKLMEESKKQGEDAVNKAKLEHKKQQVARLKGSELMRVDHLLRLGFDEEVLREHIDKANKALENDVKKSQSEKQNLSTNIQKMAEMNKQSERAVAGASGALGPLIVKQQTLEAKLEKVELELYTLETRAKHRRNMRSVEVVGKDKYKAAMKAVVRKMEQKCQDPDLVRKILKIAEKPLSTDLGLSSDDDDGIVGVDSDDDSSDDSSYDLNGSNKAGAAADYDDDDDEDDDDSSVSVSSVRTDESDEDEGSD
mmetsp:Transcript_34740/g.83956  ORF Transcript_34740/g.83956 Transcript_34740/m.83956 type:complete len:456 (+) Transcript_34740:280-1647(+)